MEIERKWMVAGWPQGLTPVRVHRMDQGYLCVRPTVRIRREALQGGPTALVLCFKGAPDPTGLSRPEVETEIDEKLFRQLEELIGKPLIAKERRSYALPGGLTLEVNDVDPGQPGEFFLRRDRIPGRSRRPRLAARKLRPGRLPGRRSDRPPRRKHGRILGADTRRIRRMTQLTQLKRGGCAMRQLKKLWTRKNWWLAVLLALELLFLGGRLAADWGAGSAIHVTPDLIIPYADKAVNDSRGCQVENYTGQFATTRWLDLEPGSYQVVVHYVNNGKAGSVKFLDEIMPTARYDLATLQPGQTSVSFSCGWTMAATPRRCSFIPTAARGKSPSSPKCRSCPPTRSPMCIS